MLIALEKLRPDIGGCVTVEHGLIKVVTLLKVLVLL